MATKKTTKVQPKAAEIAAVDAERVVAKVATLKKDDIGGEFAAIGTSLANLAARFTGRLTSLDEVTLRTP